MNEQIFETLAIFTVMTLEHREAERKADRKREQRSKEKRNEEEKKKSWGLLEQLQASEEEGDRIVDGIMESPQGGVDEDKNKAMLSYIKENSILSKSAKSDSESDLFLVEDITISGRRLILPFLHKKKQKD